MHPTFNKFTVVPTPRLDAVLKLCCIRLIFVEFGAEIKRECCRDVLLMQKLLPAMRVTFWQNNAPVQHIAVVKLLCRETT